MNSPGHITNEEAPPTFETLLALEQHALDVIPSGICVCSANGMIQRFNRRAVELWGWSPLVGDAGERFCGSYRLYHPDGRSLPHDGSPMGIALRSGEPQRGKEIVIEKPDGSRTTVRVDIELVKDSGGEVDGAIGCMQEITRRTEAEEESWRHKEWLDIATRSGTIGLWEWDLSTDHLSWTDAVYRAFGVDKESFGAKFEDLTALMHPEDRAKVSEAVERTLESGGHYEVEYRVIKRDGSTVWIYSNANVVYENGRIVRMVGVAFDMTAHMEAEMRLKEKSVLLDTIMETVPGIIWIAHDTEGKYITGSHYAAELLRIPDGINQSASAPSGDRPTHFRVLKDGAEIEVSDLPVQRAARGEESRGVELEIAFEEGFSRWVLINATPMRDSAGRVTGAVAAGFDVSERILAERQRRMLIDELNHRVKNTLAVVQGLAYQTFGKHSASQDAREAFEGRLVALAAAHNLLAQGNWEQAFLHEVAQGTIEACGTNRSRITLEGPPVLFQPKQVSTFAIAFHELCTNAMKYGALSNSDGVVTFNWHISDTAEPRLELVWRESGGPPVVPPKGRGFGLRMIEQALALEMRGSVEVEFKPEGLTCIMDAELPGKP